MECVDVQIHALVEVYIYGNNDLYVLILRCIYLCMYICKWRHGNAYVYTC